MTTLALPHLRPNPVSTTRTLVLDVVVPVFNEAGDLEASVRRLHGFLAKLPYTFRITVADNASTDGTASIARALALELPQVELFQLADKGRGRALKAAWLRSPAEVLAYMDVDLSTDLGALLPLIAPLVSGHSDVAIGTRLARGSRVVRGAKREIISRSYNFILRRTLSAGFSDAQCGFKAVRSDVATRLLPLVEDTGWFFDTELLVLAERSGLRIHEVPVDWVDDPNSSVDIVKTARADLLGVFRLLRTMGRLPLGEVRAALGRPPLGANPLAQLVRFGLVGVASTLAFLALFALLHPLGSQLANFLALAATAVANTALNRRFTFQTTGTPWRHHFQGAGVFALGLALTSGSLAVLHLVSHSHFLEISVLVLANLTATLARFVLLRRLFGAA